MYAGHAGIALLAKGVRPGLPLARLLAATFSVDLLEVALKLGGLGALVPHPAESLPVAAGLAALFGAATFVWLRDGASAVLVTAVALSHAAADLLTGTSHLWPGGSEVGLGLFRHPALDFALEAPLVLVGWLVYRRTLSPGARRSWAAWAMPVGLLALQFVLYAW